MGHESRIEPWLTPNDHVLLCWFRNRPASLRTGYENRWEKNLKSLGHSVQQPSIWCGQSEQILLNQVGCGARKSPAGGDVFFLDFPFYRTNQALTFN
jgi:hypothetical protein